MASNSIKMTFNYDGSDFKRTLKFADVADSIASGVSTIKTKVNAINTSLAGGTSGGLADFFVADDFDGTDGKLSAISDVQIISNEITDINLEEE